MLDGADEAEQIHGFERIVKDIECLGMGVAIAAVKRAVIVTPELAAEGELAALESGAKGVGAFANGAGWCTVLWSKHKGWLPK